MTMRLKKTSSDWSRMEKSAFRLR